MSIITSASGQSAWRGYTYYKSGKVYIFSEIEPGKFKGSVSGNAAAPYSVMIDTAHPRKCSCNCPHADGRRIVCKHMVALYFAAHPEEAERYYSEVIAYEEEQERLLQELNDRVAKYLNSLKKDELRQLVSQLISEMDEWQFHRFIRDYVEQDDDYDEVW